MAITAIMAFVVVLALLILAHEIGHFLAAKKSGVRVHEFGIGFPPRLLSFQRNATRYSLNLIPLGGFVRMKEYKDADGRGDSFEEKPFISRMCIVLSGAFMNVALAAILIIAGYNIGFPQIIDSELPGSSISNLQIHVISVLPESPAQRSGIMPGDEIVSLDGQPIASTDAFVEMVQLSGGATIYLEKRSDGITQRIPISAEIIKEIGDYGLGIGLVQSGVVRYPPHWSLVKGAKETMLLLGEICASIFEILSRVIRHEPIGAEVAGPVGIAILTGQVVRLGAIYLLQFAAILSLNLAIINLFPFPALDGGRAILLLVEKLRRKPLGQRVEATIHNIGFIVLIFLILVVTIKDLMKIQLFSGWF